MGIYTTSRYASALTRRFASELAESESSAYLARGKKTIREIAESARRRGEETVFIVEEREGRPEKVAEIRVLETGLWKWAGERPCKGLLTD